MNRAGIAAAIERGAVAFALAGAIAGCDAGGVEPQPQPEGTATLRAELDVSDRCNVVGVIEVQLRARWLGCGDLMDCDPDAGPLQRQGTRVTCPSTEPEVPMAVDVARAGLWRVEAVARQTTGDEEPTCLLGPDGATPVVVSVDALDASASIPLEDAGEAC